MKPHQKREILEELGWHCDRPHAAYDLLTEAERDDIIRKGHVTKKLWASIEPRLASRIGQVG